MKRIIVWLALSLVALASAQTELEFWYGFTDDQRSGWIEERIAEWNAANPEYRMVGQRRSSYPETLRDAQLAARQGNPPHLVQIYEIGSQIALDSGVYVPVGEIVPDFDFSDYIQPVLNYYTIGGQVNSIPFNSSSPVIYANQDLMAQAGLDPEDVPETFGEILEACQAAQDAGMSQSCLTFPLVGWFVEQWVAEQGETYVNNDNGRAERATEVNLTSDAVRNVFNWIKEMNDRGFYTYTGTRQDWAGSRAIFQNGEAMFLITSVADLGLIREAAEESGMTFTTGKLPIPDGATRNGVVVGGASIWVSRDHPEDELAAAVDFVLYMTNPENMTSWAELTGYYPVRTSSVEMLGEAGQTAAFEQLLETQVNSATAGALLGTFEDTRIIVEEAVQRVLGGGDVESALEDAKAQADARLQEYNANF